MRRINTAKRQTMRCVTPSKLLFIKLGEEGEWEEDCIEVSQTLRLMFVRVDHQQCLNEDWNAVRKSFLARGKTAGVATRFVTEIRNFYESDSTVMWVTFYDHRLWWCFSQPEVELLDDNTKTRPVIGTWSCETVDGKTLDFDDLSDKLLGMRNFRGTICRVAEAEYLVNKINGCI